AESLREGVEVRRLPGFFRRARERNTRASLTGSDERREREDEKRFSLFGGDVPRQSRDLPGEGDGLRGKVVFPDRRAQRFRKGEARGRLSQPGACRSEWVQLHERAHLAASTPAGRKSGRRSSSSHASISVQSGRRA